jgi:hypothetical protein
MAVAEGRNGRFQHRLCWRKTRSPLIIGHLPGACNFHLAPPIYALLGGDHSTTYLVNFQPDGSKETTRMWMWRCWLANLFAVVASATLHSLLKLVHSTRDCGGLPSLTLSVVTFISCRPLRPFPPPQPRLTDPGYPLAPAKAPDGSEP